MLEFFIWCIGIGLFVVYGLPVFLAGLAIIGAFVCMAVDGVINLFKGGKK